MAVGLSDTTIHTQARQSSRRGTIIKQNSLAFLLELELNWNFQLGSKRYLRAVTVGLQC